MSNISTTLSKKCLLGATQIFISILSAIIFTFFDFLDCVMCIFYKFLDELLEGNASSCYCKQREDEKEKKIFPNIEVDQESVMSESLYRRKNIFREMGLLKFFGFGNFVKKKRSGDGIVLGNVKNRWSDCGCESCVEWLNNGCDFRLHFVVKEPSYKASLENCRGDAAENVIFLHGFISSSSFWAETVFPNLSESVKQNYRLFAVDLLGFGKSPKPRDCLYTIMDHLEMIEKSVIGHHQLSSFHLVAHSMGCVIALALAAKYSRSVETITLIAPVSEQKCHTFADVVQKTEVLHLLCDSQNFQPYFPSKEDACIAVLERLAARRVWPPLLFGSSFMSWYEHLGRCVCFLICRNHRTWEWILKLLSFRRNLHFMINDLTRHTHHSAWHTMHNVICGGARLMDRYLEVLSSASAKIHVFHGTKDQVVPLECSSNIKMKVPNAEVSIIENADHSTVILGRESEFTKELEHVWLSSVDSIAETSYVENYNF